MPPSLPARSAATTRLPPLPKLRVRRPNRGEANPCLGMLSNVLNPRKNTLNYHLSRLYPKLIGPRKRK
ncbi:MAG: hypothetical protein M1832_005127 [Thelocarpon impressellum]|nr:MAG: hypothetical protein M1832_005127 [Thelocarpon impressellum]